MNVKLISVTPNPEKTIIEIARVSSSREDKSEDISGLINYLIKNKHWSPFEHAMLTVEIVTSKAIGIQYLRHRSFTFQEFSQRYATVTDMEPVELREQHQNNRQSSTDVFDPKMLMSDEHEWLASEAIDSYIEKGQELYKALLDNNVARECARMILPMTTQTTIYMSGTIRSWIHLLDIRDDSHAQKEARLIAQEIKKIFIQQCPMISEARGWTNYRDMDNGPIDAGKNAVRKNIKGA